MLDENDNLQLPKKPEWALTTGLKFGAVMTVVGAAIGAVFSQLPGLRGLYNKGAVAEAVESGTWGAMIGFLAGYIKGSASQAEYPLKVENAMLRHSLKSTNEALADITGDHRTHAEKLLGDRIEIQEKECSSCKLRG